MFAKKGEIVNNKFTKLKQAKVRTKNERPDIFLEGEQLTKATTAWNQEMDIKYF